MHICGGRFDGAGRSAADQNDKKAESIMLSGLSLYRFRHPNCMAFDGVSCLGRIAAKKSKEPKNRINKRCFRLNVWLPN